MYRYPAIAKGFNIYQTGDIIKCKWDLFKDPCAVSLDASRFDQHVSVEALKWTHSIYQTFCPEDEFKLLLSDLISNVGYGKARDGKVKYTKVGGRMSGDMDTALGNCLLMTAMTYSYCKSRGISHEVIDNGDDITVFMDKSDLEKFNDGVMDWYEELGFKMKVEQPAFVIEEIEFCQMHPVFDGVEWRMVRNLSSLAKDLVCTTGQKQVESWIKAIGDGGISLTAGLPVYQEFYQWLRRFGSGRKNKVNRWTLFTSSGFFRMSSLVTRDPKPVTPEARESFNRAFGMPFNVQETLERMYGDLSTGPLGINHTKFNRLHEFTKHSDILYYGTKI
jgi:hypothetical protein